MEHLDFIIWTVLFPVTISLCRLLDSKAQAGKKESSDEAQAIAALIILSIWAWVAYLLY
jgi:hypothetical protein